MASDARLKWNNNKAHSNESNSESHLSRQEVLRNQLANFQEERRLEEQQRFHDVTAVALRGIVLGVLFVASGMGLQMTKVQILQYAGWTLIPVGGVGISSGIAIFSSCPLDLIDFDQLARTKATVSVGLGFGMFLLAVMEFAEIPFALPAAIPAMLLMTMTRCFRDSDWLTPSACLFAWYILYALGYIPHQLSLCATLTKKPTCEAAPWYVAVVDLTGGSLIIALLWLWRLTPSGRLENRTLTLWRATHTFMICLGVNLIATAMPRYELGYRSYDKTISVIFDGLSKGLPSFFMITVVNRERLYRALSRRLDRKHKREQRDGAFIASLLDSVPIKIGQDWWVHRDEDQKDMNRPDDDHCRHWYRGKVASVEQDSLVVKLVRDNGEVELLDQPRPQHHVEYEELLPVLQEQLRCIEWEHIDQEMMSGAIQGGDQGEVSVSVVSNVYFRRSRRLQEDEFSDFFLSHAWGDDAQTKWSALEAVAEEFHHSRRRYPSFWLDKACIDQRQLSDGLRALPVSVMSSERMLVLVGPVYVNRLWCVWELFTALAFCRMDRVLERIKVVSLAEDADDILQRLMHFDVRSASCYDPNEESRILRVIDALGCDRFNSRIWALGKELLKQNQQAKSILKKFVGKQASSMVITMSSSPTHSRSKAAAMARNSGGMRSGALGMLRQISGAKHAEPIVVDMGSTIVADSPLDEHPDGGEWGDSTHAIIVRL